ncbi:MULTISPECIES: DUF2628 domain-containing protein [Mangrovibacter]|uniref:Uncharacterized protein DUF2628 n=1 Tax=Mangrovibacter plantisponsor TaxID=451513 RepID=A0A317PR18_9ENTR|nr:MULTISPECIES: DUF2628 domain-containing protein [Mangrovibacter]KEA50413.1 hypothetical protein DT73_23565 [Mangrovibacter sp. MFB070]PWW02614.1 uncharacterized protein DUF2628 [Mangrovibacter plantisponsor]
MTNTTLPEENYDYQQDPKVKEKWKKRFAFIDKLGGKYNGFLQTKESREELKKLPIWPRITMQMSFLAFLFGPVYLLILGLWKKAIVCFLISCVVAIIGLMIHFRFLSFFFNMYVACQTIFWYYEFKVKNKHTWSL